MSKNGWVQHPYPLKMGSQGRLTIPFGVRKAMGLTSGSKVYIALMTEEEYKTK